MSGVSVYGGDSAGKKKHFTTTYFKTHTDKKIFPSFAMRCKKSKIILPQRHLNDYMKELQIIILKLRLCNIDLLLAVVFGLVNFILYSRSEVNPGFSKNKNGCTMFSGQEIC